MIHPRSQAHQVRPMEPDEAERCRFDNTCCSWIGCQRLARFQVSYTYETRAGRLLETSRRVCDTHARQFARRFQLALSA